MKRGHEFEVERSTWREGKGETWWLKYSLKNKQQQRQFGNSLRPPESEASGVEPSKGDTFARLPCPLSCLTEPLLSNFLGL